MVRKEKHTLSGLVVRQAMRRQTIQLAKETSIDHSINSLIKYKVNALLVTEQGGEPTGVVSKSDIMGAYYAELPIDSPLEHIMVGPPLFCEPEEALETALDTMRSNSVYRLYVMDPPTQRIVGVLAYPDIVGLLYKYCHDCEYSHLHQKHKAGEDAIKRFAVGEIMTGDVQSVFETDPILQAVEVLSSYRFGAVLVKDGGGSPTGVVSKTDLALAYKHGVDTGMPAGEIMSSPVQHCQAEDLLEDAIKMMIYQDIHRLFVKDAGSEAIVGVFSLSDAARIRSGSCHACISSRIQLDTYQDS
jgi:CBS domain-containing protein